MSSLKDSFGADSEMIKFYWLASKEGIHSQDDLRITISIPLIDQ